MVEQLEQLLYIAQQKQATDIHFSSKDQIVKATIRGIDGLQELHSSAVDIRLFNYLKYLSNLDLGNHTTPQSGNFEYTFMNTILSFRFSLISTSQVQTGVLRILNNHEDIAMEDLSYRKTHYASFLRWTKTRSGLVVLSGPTGSGKSTTLHAILHRIALDNQLHVISLEDPIEINDDSYLQLQINEKNNFTYEEGIRQLMRHDPDVIMIGEIRDPTSAKMLLRCALSGHMIFTTIHAKCCIEAIKRLHEFGLSNEDLQHTLTAVSSQRLYTTKNKKERLCVYEILEREALEHFLSTSTLSKEHSDIYKEIQHAVDAGKITKKEAAIDLFTTSN